MSLGKHLEGYTVDKKGRNLNEVYMLYVDAHEACRDKSLSTKQVLTNVKKRNKYQSQFIAFIVKILVNGGIPYDEESIILPSGIKVTCYVYNRTQFCSYDLLEICLRQRTKNRRKKYYHITYAGNDIDAFKDDLKIIDKYERDRIYHKIMVYLPEEFKIFLNSHLPCTC